MTDSMKCPFCGQKLECCGTYTDGTKKLWCDNCGLFGDNRLFEALEYAIGVLDSLTEIGGVDMEIIKIKKMAGIK